MDERMSWEKHVKSICSKVSAGIGTMRRLKPFVLKLSTLKTLYNTIIQHYFDYCSPLWDNCGILKEAFRFNNERDIVYNLRSRETDLFLPLPKKEFGKRRFIYNGASHWNNLPYEAKSAESLSSFKTILRQKIC